MIQIGIISYVLLLQGIYTKDPVLELVFLEKYMEAQSAIEPDRISCLGSASVARKALQILGSNETSF